MPQKLAVQAPPVPGTRFEPPPGAVFDDANRVFGDDGPDFAPLAIVGALGLNPSASLNVVYDSNIARQPDGQPLSRRFRSKADWSFRPNVGLSAERQVGRQRLFANVGLGRVIYARNTQLNSNRFSAGGGLGFVLGRACGGQLTVGYTKRDQLIGGFEDAADATSESTTFGSSLTCSTVTGLSGSVGYSRGQRINRSSDPAVDRSFADARFQTVTGSLGYAVGRRGQVGLTGAWNENIFPNQLILGQENQNEITSIGAFASYRIGSTLRASAGVGQTKVTSQVPGSQEFTGETWNVGLGYAGPRIGASLAASQSANAGGNQSANYSIVRSYRASATYRLNDAAGLSAGVARFDQDFRGTALVPDTRRLESSKTDRVFVGADYRLQRLLSFSLDLNHQRRTAVPDRFSFESTTVVLGVRARF